MTHHVVTQAAPELHYWQAALLGLFQGVTELFPVSSIGHTVILPALLGWHNVVAAESANESFWLAFVVGLHVGTALGLLVYYRRDWARIISAMWRSVRTRSADAPDARLGWLLVVATIPAAISGALLEHVLRVLFTKPLPASIFLMVNGGILGFGEWYRRGVKSGRIQVRTKTPVPAAAGAGPTAGDTAGAGPTAGDTVAGADGGMTAIDRPGDAGGSLSTGDLSAGEDADVESDRRLAKLGYKEAALIGVAQILALVAGISRSGVTMVAGLVRGLDHGDAARFSFLLATPIILLAGLYKLPDLLGPNGAGIRGQVLVGAAVAGVAALISVSFLSRYFRTRTLLPFAVYCGVVGLALTIYFA